MTDTGECGIDEQVDECQPLDDADQEARRAFLRAAAAAVGSGLLMGRVGGTADGTDERPIGGTARKTATQPLETAVHTGPGGLNDRPFVVYREPERNERTICTASVSWQHRIVVLPRTDGQEPIYTDLYAAERYPSGSVLELVDRLSACPRVEGTLIFLRRVASPDG